MDEKFDQASPLPYVVAGVILTLSFFYIDFLLPLGVAGGIPYVALVLLGIRTRRRSYVIVGAITGSIFCVIGLFVSPPSPDLWHALINRSLALMMIILTAYFGLMEISWAEERLNTRETERAYKLLRLESDFVELNRDIAFNTNMSRSMEDAISYALKRICEGTGWPVGHLYLTEKDSSNLYPTKIWYMKNSDQFEIFRKITEETRFSEGQGLPGRVVGDGKAKWTIDIDKDPNFPRAALISNLGVTSGFAFPILIGAQIVGVMEFFSEVGKEPDSHFLDVMESIGILLGRVIERSQADKDKEEFSSQLRQLYRKLDFCSGRRKQTNGSLKFMMGWDRY